MSESVLSIDPIGWAEGDHLSQDVQEVIPGGGEDVPEGGAGVGLELDVVRQLGQAGPVLLGRGPEGEEDFAKLVQVSLPRKERNPERYEWMTTRTSSAESCCSS